MSIQRDSNDFKVLTLVTKGLGRCSIDDEESDRAPRWSLYQREMNSDNLDEHMMAVAPRWRKVLYRFLPFVVAQVIEAFFLMRKYDAVITWYDAHSLMFAALLKIMRLRVPHVALMSWISKPKKAFVLKHVYSHITTIVLWTSHHWDFAIRKLGIPPERLRLVPFYTDQQFFRPMVGEADMICSAGREMRDYLTLIEAMKGLDIRCHIAVSLRAGQIYDTVKRVFEREELPSNITVGSLPPTELRALYARSRFVVVPLLPSDSDNGLTVILEAMAMGKAVICSRTEGQRDVILDGKTGILVDQGNPIALRDTIKYFWNNPEIAEQMGREGRKRIEEMFTWEQFIDKVKEITREAVTRETVVTDKAREVETRAERRQHAPSLTTE
jgi:glycosyltransferase involved in cell wall biosynthesis